MYIIYIYVYVPIDFPSGLYETPYVSEVSVHLKLHYI